MGTHDKHRERLKKRFLIEGSDGFADHELLEIYLYYAIPQKDVNGLAHELMIRYKSFHRVFDASMTELLKIEGIGKHSAILLKIIPEVVRRYCLSQRIQPVSFLKTSLAIAEYLRPHFFGRTSECVVALYLGPNGENLHEDILFEGSFDRVHIYVREMLALSMHANSTHLIIAHNHPYGVAIPSPDDFSVTEKLYRALRTIDIELIDHYIFNSVDYVSFRESGFLGRIIRNAKN